MIDLPDYGNGIYVQVLNDKETTVADLFAVLRQWDEVVQVSTKNALQYIIFHPLYFSLFLFLLLFLFFSFSCGDRADNLKRANFVFRVVISVCPLQLRRRPYHLYYKCYIIITPNDDICLLF